MHNEMEEKYVKSLIDVIVLALLSERDAHGYDLMLRLQKEFHVILYPSTLYPLLHLLEHKGLISGESSDKRKRVYRLTDKGRLMLKTLLIDLTRVHHIVYRRLEEKVLKL